MTNTDTTKPTPAQRRVLTEAADRIAAGGIRLVFCRSDMYARLVAAGWVAGSDITDAGLAAVGRTDLIATEQAPATPLLPAQQRALAASAARSEQMLDALAATFAAPGCMVPATVDKHVAGLLDDAGFTFRGRITNRGIDRLTEAGRADVSLAVDADRIPFEKIAYDERVHRATGVKIVRLGGIWHVQAPGELPRNGGNNETEIDNIMQYAHTVVRAVLIERAAAALGVQPHELSDEDRAAAAAGHLAEMVPGPVDGFALGDVVQWAGNNDGRKWKIRTLCVPTDGDRAPYAGLDLLDDKGPGKTSTAGRLSLLVKADQPAEPPVDVVGTPIPVGAIVELVGPDTGVLTGRRGRVQESSTEADGPGRVEVLIFPANPGDPAHVRSANRLRVVELPDGTEWPPAHAEQGAAAAKVAEQLAAGRVPDVNGPGPSRHARERATEVLAELGFDQTHPNRWVSPAGASVEHVIDWSAFAPDREGAKGTRVVRHRALSDFLPELAAWLDGPDAPKIDDPAPAGGDTHPAPCGFPDVIPCICPTIAAEDEAELVELRAERDRLLAAVELHRPTMFDKYAYPTTDPAAAKHHRCQACAKNVGPGGCPTWKAAGSPPAQPAEADAQ